MLQKYCIALEDIVYWAQCDAPLHERITWEEKAMMKVKVLDNVYDLVTLNMEQRFSEHVALRFYNKDTDEVTAVLYKDYARDIRRAVSYFQSTIPDIKGKKICLLNKNCYEYAVNTFGIILAGGVLVLLNQHKSWDELSYELELVEPAAILTDGDDYGTKEQLQAAYGSILRPMDGFRAYEPVAEMPRCAGVHREGNGQKDRRCGVLPAG